ISVPFYVGCCIRLQIWKDCIVSDIEKPFLQTKAHETGHYVTLWLWLRENKSPLSLNNVRALRFKWVNHGLVLWPFLSTGLVLCHIE
ncbi:hypothetical protein Angca_001884, partial [Angiostrongylus cantonensis]